MESDSLRILVPLDGSSEAESVVPALAPLIRALPVKMTLIRAVARDESDKPARRDLERVRHKLEVRGVSVEVRVDWDDPARMISWEARPDRYDMVAMSTHGRSGIGRLVMGSIAETVLRGAKLPVLAVRPDAKLAPLTRIVVALDGSTWSERILPDVVPLARKLEATLHLVHAATPVWVPRSPEGDFAYADETISALCSVCERLGREGVTAVPLLRPLPAAEAILSTAEGLEAGLVCMTTHGRTGLARTLMGSTAEEVMRSGRCPVLVRRAVESPAPVGNGK